MNIKKVFFYSLALSSLSYASHFIQVGEAYGDFDGDGRPDSAVLLQDNRVWQIVVNYATGKHILVDQVSAPELTLPMKIETKSYPELGYLPILAIGPVGSLPVWYYQWNGHSFVDVSDQVHAIPHN